MASIVDLATAIEDAQQAVRYADKFGSVSLSEVDLEILQNAIHDHMVRKMEERSARG